MQSPYIDILTLAATAAASAPRLAQSDARPITDASAAPSDESQHERNVRLARSACDRATFAGHMRRRGDYPAIVGAPLCGTFRTYR